MPVPQRPRWHAAAGVNLLSWSSQIVSLATAVEEMNKRLRNLCRCYMRWVAELNQLLLHGVQWQQLVGFDESGSGALTADQLAAFITALTGQLPGLSDVAAHLPSRLYAAVAARKLLFFHGHHGRCASVRFLVSSFSTCLSVQKSAMGNFWHITPHPNIRVRPALANAAAVMAQQRAANLHYKM